MNAIGGQEFELPIMHPAEIWKKSGRWDSVGSEMFRFQDFHMYGIIGSAVATAAVAVWTIKKWNVKTIDGSDIHIPPKEMGAGTRYWLGGSIFGLGWAMTGACPGPMFALVGYGEPVLLVSIVSAVLGTWTYGTFRSRLPH